MLTGMGLQFNGRQVPGFGVAASDPEDGGCGHLLLPRFGVGASEDAVGAGIAAFQSKAMQLGGGGGFSPPPPAIAVAGLKAAGTAAVNTVGPAIDALSGNNPDVMKMTQQVWRLNRDQLTAVDGREGIGQAEVNAAKGIVDQMIFAYEQASNLASSLAAKASADPGQGTATSRVNISQVPSLKRAPAPRSSGSSPSTPPATAPAAPPADDTVPVTSPWTWVAVGAGVLVLVVGGVAVAARRQAA